MKVTPIYPSAAPFIRRDAAYALYMKRGARTQKKAEYEAGVAFGLLKALEYMRNSPEADQMLPGIADEDNLPSGAVNLLIQYIAPGGDRNHYEVKRMLGED